MLQREYPEGPLIGVGALIVEGERVLLVKRGHAPLAGEWSIPGGVVELGELLREAVAREAKEETGLTVEPGEILGVFDRLIRTQSRIRYHYVLIDFLCRAIAGEAKPGSDADQVRWFARKEISSLSLASDTLEVVEKAFLRAASHRPSSRGNNMAAGPSRRTPGTKSAAKSERK